MPQAGGGTIVNITSTAAMKAVPGMSAFAAGVAIAGRRAGEVLSA
jgi:short-subunit dehydrogenase